MDPSDIPEGGIDLSTQDEAYVRDFAMSLVNQFVPSTTGEPAFSEIAKDYGGAGTTCGYLCHWLMWRLGCRDSVHVNRSEPGDGLHYVPGANISKIFGNPAFVHFKKDMVPGNGDVVFLSDGAPKTEHVYVSTGINGDVWSGANAGQTDQATGNQCAVMIDRIFNGTGLVRNGVMKHVVGWVDITKLAFTANADLHGPSANDVA